MNSILINEEIFSVSAPESMSLASVLRKNGFLGTNLACKEGECGSCSLIVGNQTDSGIKYKLQVSCLSPWIKHVGDHVVSIEGLRGGNYKLNRVQEAIIDNHGSQCGFCTPGFVMAITAYFMTSKLISFKSACAAIDGQICRCTGYQSILNSIRCLVNEWNNLDQNFDLRIKTLVKLNYLPEYFLNIRDKFIESNTKSKFFRNEEGASFVGGGTDLLLQKKFSNIEKLSYKQSDQEMIYSDNENIYIRSHCSIEALKCSPLIKKISGCFEVYLELFASLPIRNIATVIGNLVNASPIADLAHIMLTLDASLIVQSPGRERIVKLREFFLEYKKVDLKAGEFVDQVFFKIPDKKAGIHFEKVSQRVYLDIASVCSSILIDFVDDGVNKKILSVAFSAGGLAAVPMFFQKTSEKLKDKIITIDTVKYAIDLASSECSPISDLRGSSKYRLILLGNLIFSHFAHIFPEQILFEDFRRE